MPEESSFSRRDLLRGRLRGLLGGSAAGPQGAAPPGRSEPARAGDAGGVRPAGIGRRVVLPIHRPPGAVDEASFLAGCTRCDACVRACPVGAIVHAPGRFREAAGTPMIDAHVTACVMCEDAPCIAACEPGVLRADQPRKMGVAWIQPMACLAHAGTFCTVCAERCPVKGAITLSAGKPTIHADVCTGCGVCHVVCPAPVNAVVVMPLADRNPSRDRAASRPATHEAAPPPRDSTNQG